MSAMCESEVIDGAAKCRCCKGKGHEGIHSGYGGPQWGEDGVIRSIVPRLCQSCGTGACDHCEGCGQPVCSQCQFIVRCPHGAEPQEEA